LMINSGIAIVWIAMYVKWRAGLLAAQKGLALAAGTAVLEAGCWLGFYASWNAGGFADERLFWLAQMLSESKVVLALASALCLTLLAKATSRPHTQCCDEVDEVVLWKEHALCVLCMLLELNRATNMHFRYSRVFKFEFVALNAAPAILCCCCLWFRVFQAVAEARTSLAKQDGESEKAVLVRRCHGLLFSALVLALPTAVLQLGDPTMAAAAAYDPWRWRYHYVVSDGLSQAASCLLLFLATLAAWPSSSLQPVGYAPQAQQEQTIGAPTIWQDDDDEEQPAARAAARRGLE